MGVKVAGSACFGLSQPTVPQSPSFSQVLASAIASPSPRWRTRSSDFGSLLCCYVQYDDSSSPFISPGIRRLASFQLSPPRIARTITQASGVALDSFSDEEFSKKMRELGLQFQLSTDATNIDRESNSDSVTTEEKLEMVSDKVEDPTTSRSDHMQSNWPDEVILANLEKKANSMNLPVSLRIIQRKMQRDEGFQEAGESGSCSVKKAFSSMVFIIRELHSFTLQMSGILLYENLQGILSHAHREMHASFVWLFQHIFSHTPTLMVYVMILLANFTVYSVDSNNAIAAAVSQFGSRSASKESVPILDVMDDGKKQSGYSSSLKSFKISSSADKTTTVGGSNGGGGKFQPVATGTGGEAQFPHVDNYRRVLPVGASSQISSFGTSSKEEESVSGREVMEEEEVGLWNSIVKEASKIQGSLSHESLDRETRRTLVSPVIAKIEADDYTDYFATEMCYQNSLTQDPNNPLLLANYAQFLYIVSNDYDRAEEYFKRAIVVEPPDAEAFNKYASFLWRVRGDLWAAEETFLEAISADPTNSFYAANYAHFLWNTGGEDTCFPLTPPATDQPSHDA